MSSSSTVTYTSVYTDSEPWIFQWVSNEEPEVPAEAPPSIDYVPEPEHPPSPNYVPGLEHPPSPDYVPGPEYPEYLVPSDAEAPIEDQPLPADASPTALSSGYIADSDPEEDPNEDLKEDPADYLTDGGNEEEEEESFGDDADDEDEEEASEDEDEEEDEEEDEHLAPADSFVVLAIDHVPSTEDTKAFETDESAPTPPSPRPRRASISIRLPPPMSASMEARIADPTYAEAPLGYRAARIRLRVASLSTHHPSEIPSPPLLLPSTTHRDDILEADMPLRKRACFTAPTSRYKVGESSSAAVARQPGLDVATVDAILGRPVVSSIALCHYI
ncbi:hypothetical protein Tco_0831723 [Tanacetum coccineum]